MIKHKHPPLETLLETIHECPTGYMEGFDAWVANNQSIFESIVDQAYLVHARGHKHYAIATLWEVARHHAMLAEKNSEFKLNNNWCADVARLIMATHPMLSGMFTLRSRFSHRLMQDR